MARSTLRLPEVVGDALQFVLSPFSPPFDGFPERVGLAVVEDARDVEEGTLAGESEDDIRERLVVAFV